jgi:hypothetical protein
MGILVLPDLDPGGRLESFFVPFLEMIENPLDLTPALPRSLAREGTLSV